MSEANTNTNTQTDSQQTQQTDNKTQPTFDYDKLASLITGKQTVAEDIVLKSYFKQQGLSADEMKQAIGAFKEQKAKNTPDMSALQNDLTAEKSARLQAEINQSATIEAVKLGVDVNTVPYLLKMADLSNAIDADGKVSTENITNALNKVLEDIPALKPKADENKGFRQIGSNGSSTSDNSDETEALRKAFGLKN